MLSDRFQLGKLVGKGSFGRIYRATDLKKKVEVAIKIETGLTASTLANEARILRTLAASDGVVGQGFARYIDFVQEGLCQLLVMEMLGKSLVDVAASYGGKLSLTSTVLAAQQMLQRVEFLHSRGIVHQDIKPDNFLFGVGARLHHLHLIDFGLSKAYFDRSHVRMCMHRGLVGTARYASLNAHARLEQSRRDDLEALGYVWLYLLRGELPWTGLKASSSRQKIELVGDCKRATPLRELCEGVPEVFASYLAYCRELTFTQRPDYDRLHGLLQQLRQELSEEQRRDIRDSDFDWIARRDRDRADLEALRPVTHLTQPDDACHRTRRRDFLFGCVTAHRGCVSNPKVSAPQVSAPAPGKAKAAGLGGAQGGANAQGCTAEGFQGQIGGA